VKQKTVFKCSECGKDSPKWQGRCDDCGAWNSFIEEVQSTSVFLAHKQTTSKSLSATAKPLNQVGSEEDRRIPLKMGELARVLGGGLVPGSITLIGGEPGIGKSTLLLQLCADLAGPHHAVYYISGEESHRQINLRAVRLGIDGSHIHVVSETDINACLALLNSQTPALVVADSVQTLFAPEIDSAPGSVTQVRECAIRLMNYAKDSEVPVFLSGHVNKEGLVAGPRVLEHVVDTVMYMEGEKYNSYRILRSAKNRFGSVSEVGIFSMNDRGLAEVSNPSSIFIGEHEEDSEGACVVPLLEGTRPLLVELQALVSPSIFGLPRRTASGFDSARLIMLAAVITRRVFLKLGDKDIIVSSTGGIKVTEPAADLALTIAIASSALAVSVKSKLVAIGEIGLSGEIRPVADLERRLKEASRLGFKTAIVPKRGVKEIKSDLGGLRVIPASNVKQAIRLALVETEAVQKTPTD